MGGGDRIQALKIKLKGKVMKNKITMTLIGSILGIMILNGCSSNDKAPKCEDYKSSLEKALKEGFGKDGNYVENSLRIFTESKEETTKRTVCKIITTYRKKDGGTYNLSYVFTLQKDSNGKVNFQMNPIDSATESIKSFFLD